MRTEGVVPLARRMLKGIGTLGDVEGPNKIHACLGFLATRSNPILGAPLNRGMGWPEVEALPQTCKMFPEHLLEPNLFRYVPPPRFPGSSRLEACTLFVESK